MYIENALYKFITIILKSRGGDSYMEQTGMLVVNFEFNP